MADQKNVVSSTLASEFRAVYLKDDWFKGLLLHLEGVTAEHASRPNPGGTSSAAGQVGHVLYWLRIGTQRLAGKDAEGNQDASFQHMQVTESEWQALKEELQAELQNYEQAIRQIDEWNSEKLKTVLNQIAHASYHAGSVIQILKASA